MVPPLAYDLYVATAGALPEFYGQRPWRAGKMTIEPPDATREREGIAALQYKETTTVQHSLQIMALLKSAISHYKRHLCRR